MLYLFIYNLLWLSAFENLLCLADSWSHMYAQFHILMEFSNVIAINIYNH